FVADEEQEGLRQIPKPAAGRSTFGKLVGDSSKDEEYDQPNHDLPNPVLLNTEPRFLLILLVQIAQLAKWLRDQNLAGKMIVVVVELGPHVWGAHIPLRGHVVFFFIVADCGVTSGPVTDFFPRGFKTR